MNLCVSSQWEMVYWLVLCCYKIGACVLSYGWPCFRKTSVLFDCIFVQDLGNGNFCTCWGKSFLEFCSVNLLVPDGLHSNEAGEFTAGIVVVWWSGALVSVWKEHFGTFSSFKNGQ